MVEHVLIDTHCHLDRSSFEEGADAPIERARSEGVSAFVCIGVGGREASDQALELARRRTDVVCTLGVHPHDASEADDALVAELGAALSDESVVAVGEIGLDHHYDNSPRDVQAEVFRRFVSMARDASKPIVIHTRSAPAETLEILESENARDVGGVIHCFSEDRSFARRALDLGFDVSFSGIVTFKNARAVQDVAAWAPLDRILVETDSPYLAPVPKRGRKNEPAYVVHTAAKVAELRGLTPGEVARATTENACRRFGPAMARALTTSQTNG